MPPKILIANRGEIALRVIRACREMGMLSVVAFSEADRESLPVMLADESVCIGSGPAVDSYLKVDRIIAAAELAGATAIHPGYGFLAENAHFAEICQDCRIKFIGPSSSAISAMGNKNMARELMSKCGVPVVPGSDGMVSTLAEARAWAAIIGYPVMIKAAAGGGGKGMRRVMAESEMEAAFNSAQREARQAFGSEELFLEKFIENPKHVEIQILADSQGNTVFLGERDCSMQRRHQKVIEESPCMKLDDATREAMGNAAILAAKSVGYSGAGTVEFLLSEDNSFYFMEMNTRIQVEHPVTEVVTGRDLVCDQLRIAMGEELGFTQQDVACHGHCVELRINAEDISRNFAPSPGKVLFYSSPGGPGVRVDSHLYSGCYIPPYYDSLLGKVIVYGETREKALSRAERALDEFLVEGVSTNSRYVAHLLHLPEFVDGSYTTESIERDILSLGENGLANLQ